MEGARLIQKLRLTNFLSYGPEGEEIELQPLNVLIGPNGSGKSNLLAALSLLHAAPFVFSLPIRAGGGITEWIYKGNSQDPSFTLQATVSPLLPRVQQTLRYRCRVRSGGRGPDPYMDEEEVAYEPGPDAAVPSGETLYSLYRGTARIRPAVSPMSPATPPSPVAARPEHALKAEEIDRTQSVLAEFREPEIHPEIMSLAWAFSRIHPFRDTHFGPRSPLRWPQRTESSGGDLSEDGTNFGVVLFNLLADPAVKKRLIGELRRLDPFAEDISAKIFTNTIEVQLYEAGLRSPIPATRLSDGILRYLFLLSILLDVRFLPRLVCIEDPEIGLHPDVLPSLAKLLIEASAHSQIVVTTHSDILVSALSEVPEAVVVCERDDGGTHLRRLDPEAMKEWLEDYSLGGLWRMGELGGNP
jgi:predicted ATPase